MKRREELTKIFMMILNWKALLFGRHGLFYNILQRYKR